jgi:hypothetical protein
MGREPGETAEESLAAALRAQWALGLDGPRAPGDVIAGSAREGAAPSAAAPQTAPRGPTPRDEGGHEASAGEIAPPSGGDATPRVNGLAEGVASTAAREEAETSGETAATPPRIAPPALAAARPLYGAKVGQPPQPAAALALERSLLDERSQEDGDDLAALQAKIKRILDEEARRYGIDV